MVEPILAVLKVSLHVWSYLRTTRSIHVGAGNVGTEGSRLINCTMKIVGSISSHNNATRYSLEWGDMS